MEETNKPMPKPQENDNNIIRMKIIYMMEYAMPLLERWSTPHQKMLGNRIAECMEDMLELASELQWSYSKKTPHRNLDMKNHALQDYITLAYRLKYLKGAGAHSEWTKLSVEIGRLIGGYGKYLYGESQAAEKPAAGPSEKPPQRPYGRATSGGRNNYRTRYK